MADLSALVEQLDNLTLLEAAQLSKMLQEKWGVSAAAPVAMAAPGGGGGPAPEEEVVEEADRPLLAGHETRQPVVGIDAGPDPSNDVIARDC